MLIKALLSAGIIAACALCGHAISGSSQRRIQLLSEILSALRILRIELCSMRVFLSEGLAHTRMAFFEALANALSSGKTVDEAWTGVRSTICRRGGGADCLSQTDLSALDRLFCRLGTSGCAEQAEAIDRCICLLEEALSEAKNRFSQVGKIYIALGLLTGFALVILMI